jgi:hypothetical protein
MHSAHLVHQLTWSSATARTYCRGHTEWFMKHTMRLLRDGSEGGYRRAQPDDATYHRKLVPVWTSLANKDTEASSSDLGLALSPQLHWLVLAASICPACAGKRIGLTLPIVGGHLPSWAFRVCRQHTKGQGNTHMGRARELLSCCAVSCAVTLIAELYSDETIPGMGSMSSGRTAAGHPYESAEGCVPISPFRLMHSFRTKYFLRRP